MGRKTTKNLNPYYILLITFLTAVQNCSALDKQRFNSGLKWMSTPYSSMGKETSCIRCHYTNEPDTFFWKPSLAEISRMAIKLGPEGIQNQLRYPFSERLSLDHEGISLSDSAIADIHYFLTHTNPGNLEPDTSKRSFPWALLAVALILFSLVDMWLIQLFEQPFISKTLLIAGLISGGHLLAKELESGGLQEGYEPNQPLKFSHKVHCKQNNIDCFYCHAESRHGARAGIPSTKVCLNCHSIITEGGNSGEFYIKQIQEADLNNTPIEWVKVHNLPDHVHFNHALHVEKGKLDCQKCHGEISQMNRIKQIEPLSMKWCLDCHRTMEVQTTDNNKAKVSDTGGFDCMRCHY